ncbi:MAG: cation:proton antiporter [Sphingopyxis terrae]|jgi:CPA2 family monovalent cation:H+ antiporter-2|uniref:cation:proton antiporter domain-containing protein n=1 Tax=unclassified Sphingopyxis TaxID=2614943 RepID=UPI00086CCB64|nr:MULTISPECIES: cation:proton antiporter [unclassified Sphingopyxis]MBD3746889.1 cation:proton antiporter [Sphingopyxis terrae]MBU7588578.1 cation:proton antiporter [Sphingopyxis terrae]ODU24503.1 MAG: sodium:proton exchanger [Sphingopyxis sp. SCN 67-31]
MVSEQDTSAIGNALVVLGAAGIVIPAFARFRISPVIGFILVGLLVGPSGLGALAADYPWLRHITIASSEDIALFGEFGIILLLFSIGLELSFRRLWQLRKLVFGIGAAELLLGGAILGTALFLLGDHSTAAAYGLGIALALSSTALVLPIAGTKSAVGRASFAMLLFEDLAIVPIIFVLGALSPIAASDNTELMLTTLWQGALVVAILAVAGWFLLPRIFAQAARAKDPELFLAASLLVVIVAALATAAVGLSPIVGALLAGLMIAETEYHGEVEAITAPFKGLALGVFLISVGMGLNLKTIAAQWPELIAAVVGVVLIKSIVTAALLRFSGAARRGTAAEVGLLMASPSETTLIVLATALQAQLISRTTAEFWQLVTAIGLTITPLLARVGHDVARRIEMRSGDAQEEETPEGRTVVVGFGRVGRTVAELLREHQRRYVAVDADIDTVAAARRDGFSVRFADVARPGSLDRMGIENADAIVLTMDDPVQQLRMTRQLRQKYPELPIISRARDADHAAALYRAGATDAVPETLESSLQLAEAVLVDLGVAMGPVIASIHDVRARMRHDIMTKGELADEPRIRKLRRPEGSV